MEFSVIIPTYNCIERLLLTLHSFCLQTFDPALFELIIVDNGSTDNTREMLSTFEAPFQLRYVCCKKTECRAFARNNGFAHAKGKYVVFCDSDFIVTPNFLEVLRQNHMKYKRTILSTVPLAFQDIYSYYYPDFSKRQKLEMFKVLSPRGLWDESFKEHLESVQLLRKEHIPHKLHLFTLPLSIDDESQQEYKNTDVAPWLLFVTRCVSLKKKYLHEVGGFDESFVKYGLEDWELGYRLHLNNYKFHSISQPLGFHQLHPKCNIDADDELDNLRIIFHKHGFTDPELNLFTVCPPWMSITRYKNKLRKYLKYESQGRYEEATKLKREWQRNALKFYHRE